MSLAASEMDLDTDEDLKTEAVNTESIAIVTRNPFQEIMAGRPLFPCRPEATPMRGSFHRQNNQVSVAVSLDTVVEDESDFHRRNSLVYFARSLDTLDEDESDDTVEVAPHEIPEHFREQGGRLFHSHGACPYPLPVDAEEQTVSRSCAPSFYLAPWAESLIFPEMSRRD